MLSVLPGRTAWETSGHGAASKASEDPASLTDREKELGAILLAYSDVTERLKGAHDRLTQEVSRLRDELHVKNEALRRSERLAALGEMAAGLAHEIRNPLGGIALYASMLEQALADRPAEQSSATRISFGVRTLDRLVSEILEFAQEDRLEFQACRLGVVLSGAEEAAMPWAAEHDVTVSIAPEARNIDLVCDVGCMRQVMINLMMNAVQAVDSGGTVQVAANHLSDGTGLEIEVLDDGPGITAELAGRIFNPFFTTKSSGTGLGLAIAHRIVEAHGGTVRAMNRNEGGARFVVRLPATSPAGRAVICD